MYYNQEVKENVKKCLSSVWRATPKVDFYNIFRPSWGITVVGFLPFVGNVTNFGCAIHGYRHGQIWYGHQKMAEALIGTTVDMATIGSTSSGLKLVQVGMTRLNAGLMVAGTNIVVKDLAVRTTARLGAFGLLQYVMDPFYHKY